MRTIETIESCWLRMNTRQLFMNKVACSRNTIFVACALVVLGCRAGTNDELKRERAKEPTAIIEEELTLSIACKAMLRDLEIDAESETGKALATLAVEFFPENSTYHAHAITFSLKEKEFYKSTGIAGDSKIPPAIYGVFYREGAGGAWRAKYASQ